MNKSRQAQSVKQTCTRKKVKIFQSSKQTVHFFFVTFFAAFFLGLAFLRPRSGNNIMHSGIVTVHKTKNSKTVQQHIYCKPIKWANQMYV